MQELEKYLEQNSQGVEALFSELEEYTKKNTELPQMLSRPLGGQSA